MFIVRLFVTYARVNLCHFFSSSWCRGLAVASACGSSWTFLFTFFLWHFTGVVIDLACPQETLIIQELEKAPFPSFPLLLITLKSPFKSHAIFGHFLLLALHLHLRLKMTAALNFKQFSLSVVIIRSLSVIIHVMSVCF